MGNVIFGNKIYHKDLHSRFWTTDDVFVSDVRKKLLGIAMDFYKTLDIDVHIHDIILTGSLANYNYNDFSDLDVHIILDFADITSDPELLESHYAGVKFRWEQEHDIKIRGAEVELYAQDSNSTLIAGGVYSLLFNEWNIKPDREDPVIDSAEVEFKTKNIIKMIDKIEESFKQSDDEADLKKTYKYALRLAKRITGRRKYALAEDGEFSVDNLVFKQLRNFGEIDRIYNIANRSYDAYYEEDAEDLLGLNFGISKPSSMNKNMPKSMPGSHAKKNFNIVQKEKREQQRAIPQIVIDMKAGKPGRMISSAEVHEIKQVYGITAFSDEVGLGNTGIIMKTNPNTGRYKLIMRDK